MDKELAILEHIQNNPHVNQRDLATIAQASLGMTNAILKRFVQKGFITIQKVNNRNIRYALTPEGSHEIGRRSWSYFKRTIKNVVVFRDAIAEIIRQAKVDGYSGVLLIGESDLAFIVEHECYKQGVDYTFEVEGQFEESTLFRFFSETLDEAVSEDKSGCFALGRLVTGG